MSKVTKNERISTLEKQLSVMQTQISSLIECAHSHTERLIALEPNNPLHGKLYKPEQKLKTLDQSIFDGLDEKWRFAAVDADGSANGFDIRVYPRGGDEYGLFAYESNHANSDNNSIHIGTGYDTSNWQNSLIERDIAKELLEVDLSSELIGSELCKAMLARGDKFVLCGVSDSDDSDAENHEDDDFLAEVVTDFDDKDGLFGTTSMQWIYAVPINNQGEPLTASEAGL